MHTFKIDEELDCGIRVAFKVFGGKWKLCIIDAISRGVSRPADIHREIKSASLRVIEMQLAELLHFGAVCKCADDAFPKRSDYRLTPLGESILPVLTQIDRWGAANAAFVKEKQFQLA